MTQFVKPSEAPDLTTITRMLDAATPEQRFTWIRSLGRSEQSKLFDLAKGTRCTVADLVEHEADVVVCDGKNGVPVFSKFKKVFTKLGDEYAGWNDNTELAGPLSGLAGWLIGPGHFTAYDDPAGTGEIFVDYRKIPARQHPSFPPLVGNEHGIAGLVFGDMVDVVRRVSEHVYVGDSFKGKYPRTTPPPMMARIGAMLATAPFVMCRRVR